jgi:UDP-N-acetyl-D-mannosaminuronate dehydrogenase
MASLARRINDSQAEHITLRLESVLGTIKGSRILMMGLGFRPGVKEDTKSPAYLIKAAIERRGGKAFICDPLYGPAEFKSRGFSGMDPRSSSRLDGVILVTAHRAFLRQDWSSLRRRGVRAFVDGRNCFDPAIVERHGIRYIGIGKGL